MCGMGETVRPCSLYHIDTWNHSTSYLYWQVTAPQVGYGVSLASGVGLLLARRGEGIPARTSPQSSGGPAPW